MGNTINQRIRNGGKRKSKKHDNRGGKGPLQGRPQLRGVCSSVGVRKPKKPNSAMRKITYVTLSTGQKIVAYIPGEGHNLQDHSVVLVGGGNAKDTPETRAKVIAGVLDRAGIADRKQGRSKYGAKKTKN